MNSFIKVNDIWKEVKSLYIKQNDIWKEVKEQYIKVDNVWKQSYQNTIKYDDYPIGYRSSNWYGHEGIDLVKGPLNILLNPVDEGVMNWNNAISTCQNKGDGWRLWNNSELIATRDHPTFEISNAIGGFTWAWSNWPYGAYWSSDIHNHWDGNHRWACNAFNCNGVPSGTGLVVRCVRTV